MFAFGLHKVFSALRFGVGCGIAVDIHLFAGAESEYFQLDGVFAVVVGEVELRRRDHSGLVRKVVIVDSNHAFCRAAHVHFPPRKLAVFVKVVVVEISWLFGCAFGYSLKVLVYYGVCFVACGGVPEHVAYGVAHCSLRRQPVCGIA